ISPETDFEQFNNLTPRDREIHSAISAPMIIQDKLLGVLNGALISQDREFDDSDLRKVQIFANSTAAAINNLKLIDRLKLNIEHLKRAQNQLIQSEKLSSLGQLTAGVCHEIASPLSVISAYSELVMKRSQDEVTKTNTKKVLAQVERCNKILRNLMDFSREGKMEKRKADLNQLVNDIIGIMTPQLKMENIQIDKNLDENLSPVFVDTSQIQQVIMNIINNARQALSERKTQKRITIESRKTGGGYSALSISNNGGEIPNEIMGKIFDPFFTTKKKGEGTGLGLSICYGIVSKHDGKLTAFNKNGDTAEFLIELPVAENKES
ncbi:MAG: GHKL domain-containing protein, partial [Thermoplasmata archaeon]|nr:GHKL domain-containing protein [Thermoplasmata archaeon]